jgi:hypothetical protein
LSSNGKYINAAPAIEKPKHRANIKSVVIMVHLLT